MSPLNHQLFKTVCQFYIQHCSSLYQYSLFSGYLSFFSHVNPMVIHSSNPPPNIKRLHQSKFQDSIKVESFSTDPFLLMAWQD